MQNKPITNQDIKDMAHPLKNEEPVKEEALPLAHTQLLEALYWIHDVFERANINMFLVYNTAEDVLKKKALDGDAVRVGVRQLEWESGSKHIIDSAAQYESIDGNKVHYRCNNGVPVIVHVYKDDECISSPDIVMYQHEYFKLPNPYSRFKEVFGESA